MRQKHVIRRQAQRIDELETEVVLVNDALVAAKLKLDSYGKQIERVRGAHLIKQLAEAGIKYQVTTTRWQVALPAGVLEVESLPVAIQSIRDAASPPAADHHLHDDPALLGDNE